MSDEPTPVDDPIEPRTTTRRKWLIISAVAIVAIAVGVGAVLVHGGGPATEDQYLEALKKAGQMSTFPADRAAVANAHRVCDSIDNGGKDQGTEADKIGVQFYCKDYLASFKVLRKVLVSGTFRLVDFKSVANGCSGVDGYNDINSSTQVVLKGASDNEVARTQLGPGSKADSLTCQWTFNFDVTEGEDHYVLSVGHRGESTYSFDQLTEAGNVALTLG